MAPITETVTIINKSGKVVSTVSTSTVFPKFSLGFPPHPMLHTYKIMQ